MSRIRFATIAFAVLSVGLTSVSSSQGWKVAEIHTLPAVTLSSFLQEQLGISADDRGIMLGGVGSDLWRSPSDGPGILWMITDRGPNGENPRTFPVNDFTPFILKVRAVGGEIEVLEALPITDGAGHSVTGLSNLAGIDELPFDCRGEVQLSFNPEGLDTEGLVRLRGGRFWLVEEYSPSFVEVSRSGAVIARFVPEGLNLPGTTYPVIPSLPEVFRKRKVNRGFEGLAVSPDEKTMYAALQSPLSNPTAAVGNPSRNTRILALDPDSGEPVAEYVYEFQPASEFAAGPADMKVSAVVMLDNRRMLVLERTDDIARVYLVDLHGATNILGTSWDQIATSPSLESLSSAGLAAAGIGVLPKTLVIELDSADGFPKKIEGLAVIDGRTIAIANDNDFGVGTFNKSGGGCTLIDTGRRRTIEIIRLDKPIK